MTRRSTSEGVIDISVCVSSFSVLPFYNFAITVLHQLSIHLLWLSVSRRLCISCRSLGSYLLRQQRLFFLSATVAQDLVSLLPVEEPHRNLPRVGAADRTYLWATSMSDLPVVASTFSLKILDAVVTGLVLSLWNFANTKFPAPGVLLQIVLFLFARFNMRSCTAETVRLSACILLCILVMSFFVARASMCWLMLLSISCKLTLSPLFLFCLHFFSCMRLFSLLSTYEIIVASRGRFLYVDADGRGLFSFAK